MSHSTPLLMALSEVEGPVEGVEMTHNKLPRDCATASSREGYITISCPPAFIAALPFSS